MTIPANCTMLIALPTSREGFHLLREQTTSEYVNHFVLGWEQYERVSASLNRAVEQFRELGIGRIVCDAESGDWASSFERHDVVILFAHWIEDDLQAAVEFFDGPYPVGDMLNAIPPGFAGIVDLSVCHPYQLVKISPQTRKYSICYSEFEAHPIIWTQIYSTIFEVLKNSETDYRTAATDVVQEYRKQSKPRRPIIERLWRKR